MFIRGFVLIALINLMSAAAFSMNCQMIFKPLKVVSSKAVEVDQSQNHVEREINPHMLMLMAEHNIIRTDIDQKKLMRLAAENPFLYEAFYNIASSLKDLKAVVASNYNREARVMDMVYASALPEVSSHTIKESPEFKNNSKVIQLSAFRDKKAKEEEKELEAEKEDYASYINDQFSEINYVYFHQLHDFLSVINTKLHSSPTVKLTATEYNILKEVADNYKVYSNYLFALSILETFQGASRIKLTAVLSRDSRLHQKFMDYKSYLEEALQQDKYEEVLSRPEVERVQKQLLSEVEAVHLEGSEKHFANIIRYMKSRLED